MSRITIRVLLVAVLCWAAPGRAAPGVGGLSGPQDHTPLCHYLERGHDDFRKNRTASYVVAIDGVETLADIDHLTLGLDLPYTRCRDNPRSQPCSDEDITPSWCVESVALKVGAKTLFERSEPGGCAFSVGGGLGGLRCSRRLAGAERHGTAGGGEDRRGASAAANRLLLR